MTNVVMIPKYPDEKSTGSEQVCPACNNCNPVDCNVCEGRGIIFSNQEISNHNEGLVLTRGEALAANNDDRPVTENQVIAQNNKNDLIKKLLYLLFFLLLLYAIYYIFQNSRAVVPPNKVQESENSKELNLPKLRLPQISKKTIKGPIQKGQNNSKSGVSNIDLDKIDKNWQFYGEKITPQMLKSSKVNWNKITPKDIKMVSPKLKKAVKRFCSEQSAKGIECYPEIIGHPVLKNRAYKRIGEKVLKLKQGDSK